MCRAEPRGALRGLAEPRGATRSHSEQVGLLVGWLAGWFAAWLGAQRRAALALILVRAALLRRDFRASRRPGCRSRATRRRSSRTRPATPPTPPRSCCSAGCGDQLPTSAWVIRRRRSSAQRAGASTTGRRRRLLSTVLLLGLLDGLACWRWARTAGEPPGRRADPWADWRAGGWTGAPRRAAASELSGGVGERIGARGAGGDQHALRLRRVSESKEAGARACARAGGRTGGRSVTRFPIGQSKRGDGGKAR